MCLLPLPVGSLQSRNRASQLGDVVGAVGCVGAGAAFGAEVVHQVLVCGMAVAVLMKEVSHHETVQSCVGLFHRFGIGLYDFPFSFSCPWSCHGTQGVYWGRDRHDQR